VIAVNLEGKGEVFVRVGFPAFPMCFDWLPDGVLIVSGRDGLLLRREPDGSLVTHADLSGLAEKGHPWNEIVVDGRGNAYINNQGFEFPGGEFAPGTIALLTPDGSARHWGMRRHLQPAAPPTRLPACRRVGVVSRWTRVAPKRASPGGKAGCHGR
jgi:sugar lactone lactonase YvrE